ncbi:DUF305 domain-containing protein [Phyllobacterium sp. SYP-B3895]|uniref:CopM family metallochaperone n=1 Tax=Phyllobacterium sp. SYP-B3895 TaxID=2663240 RepID=UPI001299F304|nr:DUF305 domain-containing protein [Phyllobacterium sp. SYP-B3895]MRG55759.1 DUF305 domain-containing protein [Phyllobacterium sp. SYP-B3895]
MNRVYTTALVLGMAFATPVIAQDHSSHGTMQHEMTAKPAGDQSAPSKAFAAANAKMHEDMAIEFTGKADEDFVRGMIAHHQGAIDMAKVELEYGKDAEIRKLASEIIAAQEAEIKQMKSWLAKNGG